MPSIDIQDTKVPPLGEAEAASLTFSEVVVDADGDVEAVFVLVASDESSNT